ncbi:MAG: T9SS type A sorting domain-containing protein [Bacteroidetes bacterium]|nr:T9SS type A sorting domain-containing protein [Bacteroidota bacterium]
MLLFSSVLPAHPQAAFWREAAPGFETSHGKPSLNPVRYRIFLTSEDSLNTFLAQVSTDYRQAGIISLPQANGSLRRFRIWQTPAMEADLAARHPELKTFTAEALDNPWVTAKLDYTPYGFHALVFDGDQCYLIDPYHQRPDGAYLVYFRQDYQRPLNERMFCAAEDEPFSQPAPESGNAARTNGTQSKTYRLALAATFEYCSTVAGVGASRADVLAKMLTTINRVNGVYERELSVSMKLIANEDTLIFNTDPSAYTNNNGGIMLSQNQAIIDARIGTANYDIGHVFSTGGGGIAYQGCVCDNLRKARGVTGSASPVGDAFDIDYVAHEMGHQFGAGHTFNASTGSCAGNGVRSISFEPGAGSTIMAYAGICGGGNDFQAHSDPYFHSASLEQISQYITSGTGRSCPDVQPTPNSTNATLEPFSAEYFIPYKTPFELTAPLASDNTADTLHYCWEQRDAGGIDFGKSLALTYTQGPLFRSFLPDSSRTRVFPALNRLLNGLSTPGEKLPDTARDMHFGLTERDILAGWGNFNFPDDRITLHVVQTPTLFQVESFSTPDTVLGRSLQVIQWDIAGTDQAPISCTKVDILLSVDGGYSYPDTLLAATDNDGVEALWLPNPPTTHQARIKVKGRDNVFFNINKVNFSILHSDTLQVPPPPPPVAQVLSIAPVPAGQSLQIQIPDSIGNLSFSLLNTQGQVVLRGYIAGRTEIATAGLARGIYFLKLYGLKLKLEQRILLQ